MLTPEKVPYRISQPNNMGIMRYILASSVLIEHFNQIAGASIWSPVSAWDAVGGFFALSGFLMVGSWLRSKDLKRYLLSRARRILPAYWAVVLFFAIAFYPISSTPDYFLSSGFWKYLVANMSFLNFLHPDLPGVFSDLPVSAVNGSLWTMKVEWLLYISLPVVAWFLIRMRRNPVVVLASVYILSVAYRLFFTYLFTSTGKEIYDILSRQFMGQMMFFYSGVFLYYYFGWFRRFRYPILAAALAIYMLGYPNEWLWIAIQPAVVSVLVVWFSMFGKWGTWAGKHDNISYNIYLIHFPIEQLCANYVLVSIIGLPFTFIITVSVTLILSWMLNQWVELPIRRKWKIA